MGHINRHASGPKSVRKVADSWLPLSQQITKIANTWSRRIDLTAYIGVDGGQGIAAALYNPLRSEIEINTVVAFGEHTLPMVIGDFTERKTHYEWPAATGAILHEAMHAQYTTDLMCHAHEVLGMEVDTWFEALDEPRIEGLGVKQYPDHRVFLRACALGIVLKDTEENLAKMTRTEQAARLGILAIGRVDAGVLKKKDVKTIRPKVIEILTEEVYRKLRELWVEFLDLRADVDIERMYQIAREFHAIVQEQAKNDPPAGDDFDFLKDLFQIIRGDKIATDFGAFDEAFDQESSEKAEKRKAEKDAESAERQANKTQADKTFRDSTPQTQRRTTNSRLIKTRPASPEERKVAHQIADALKRAKYRDRIITQKSQKAPPGRLNVGMAIQNRAVKSRGGLPTADPWSSRQYKRVDDPNLTVGIMCDISGSMGGAMEPIAVSAWVMSHAVQKIQGRAAAVYFGNDVFSVLKPGEFLKDVNVYSAADGTESFDKAFRSLDGGLNLLDGSGARLVVVCSDGQYGGRGELEAVEKWLNRCREKGVAVIWLDYKDSPRIREIERATGAVRVQVGSDVVAAAQAIGQACIEALRKASR